VCPFPHLDTQLSDGIVSLRRFTIDDVAEVTRACQDSESVHWTASIPNPYTESDAQGRIERQPEHWDSGFTASFAIVDANDGTFMGSIEVIVPPDALGRAAMGTGWPKAVACEELPRVPC
jgi:RimJ/RimL family protein N-acetyltransferase